MGHRLYNPVSGQFLTVDPIPAGNATAYDYPTDPVNRYDLNGEKGKGGRKPESQPKHLTDAERLAINNKKAGRPYNKKAYNSGHGKEIFNEKVQEGTRNKNKRQGGNQSLFVGAKVALGAGGAGAALWWLAKLASPLCGPAAPACAIAF
jgi:hypothetical protein